MNNGLIGISQPHRYESEEQPLASGVDNIFALPIVRLPDSLNIWLVCAVSNNGYVAGEHVPISVVVENNGASTFNGGPKYTLRLIPGSLTLRLDQSNAQILDTAIARQTFTASQWRIKLTATFLLP